jgi:hypothetical protein
MRSRRAPRIKQQLGIRKEIARIVGYSSRVPDQHVPVGCSHPTRVHQVERNRSRSDAHVD